MQTQPANAPDGLQPPVIRTLASKGRIMKQAIKALVKRVPFISDLSKQVSKQGAYPAGHYYSPIPAREDVLSYVKSRTTPASDLPGINLNEKNQREALAEYTGSITIFHSQRNKQPRTGIIMRTGGLAIPTLFFYTVSLDNTRRRGSLRLAPDFHLL